MTNTVDGEASGSGRWPHHVRGVYHSNWPQHQQCDKRHVSLLCGGKQVGMHLLGCMLLPEGRGSSTAAASRVVKPGCVVGKAGAEQSVRCECCGLQVRPMLCSACTPLPCWLVGWLVGWLPGCASGGSLWRLGVHLVAEQAQAGCVEHLSSTGGPCIRYAHRHLQRMRKHDPTVGAFNWPIGK